ncbi:MAG: transposase [Patescibacteria group bacterium]
MGNRKDPFINEEYYHIYNRGVEKRNIFIDTFDIERFVQSILLFNSPDPIGSIYEMSFEQNNKLGGRTAKLDKLVEFVAYCLNPNHYHFILRQLRDGGISEFMKRLGGYTWYFNNRHKRVGPLFQGRFKSVHVDSNDYLLYLSAYVNLNYHAHQLGGATAKLVRSSWMEYLGEKSGFCKKDIVLGQFNTTMEYKNFAEESFESILEKKNEDIRDLLLDL